ncbi:MAG: hypothetical protein WC538_18815 [Thermoanaerobaculia bacterium]|jgi:tetratricopeptide (TPR) repeat protein
MRNQILPPSLLAAVVALALASGSLMAAVAPAASRAEGSGDTRAQLASYFDNIGTNSPTVLGALQKSPETVDAIRSRIDSMSDAEVAELQKMMAEMPTWEIAPEAMAEALPLDMRQQLTSAGRYYGTKAKDVQALRNDAFTLIAVAKLLPKEQLAKLGIDGKSVAAMETTLGSLDPLQTALLQERLARESQWATTSRAAIDSLPERVQKGAFALASHGVLTQQDLAGLDEFRRQMVAITARIDALPPSMRKDVSSEAINTLRGRLTSATPDMLFMIRSQLTDEQIATMAKSVELLERVSSLDDEELAGLEQFREQLRTAVGNAGTAVNEQIDRLRPDQLIVLQDEMSKHPEWKGVMPVVAETLRDPAVGQAVQQAAAISPGSARAAELEKFRNDAILYVRSAEGAPGVTPELARRSIEVLEGANLAGLTLIHQAALKMPADAPKSALVSLPPLVAENAVNLDCVVSLGSISLPLGIGTVSLGSIDFNWICTPLENAINSVESVVSSVVTIATDIWNFVQTLPQLAVDAIKAAFNALLDIEIANGVTLRALLAQGVDSALAAMKQALGLAGSWWTTIQGVTLPEIPCPPRNTWTPFGQVGSSDALRNYSKYKFIMDKLIEMIPDTEVSLPVKISAQVLYAGFEYLGVCLEIEASAVDEEVTNTRWETSATNQGSIFTSIGNHDVNMTNQHNALSLQLNNQGAALTSLVQNESLTIQTKVQVASDLNLRLAIERVLQAGEGSELAMFQLPRPWGQLELVREIVSDSIDGVLAVGGVVNQAGKYLSKGDDYFRQSKYKEAFEEFQKAYRELTR